MRALAVLALVAIVLMFLGGWLYYQDNGSTSEIILDKQKVQQDTDVAVQKGKEVAEKAAQEMKELGRNIEDSVSGEGAEEETTPVPNTADSQ